MAYRFGAIHNPRPEGLPAASQLARAVFRPKAIDWLAHLAPDGNALGNDRYGCCVPAADLQLLALRRAIVWGSNWRPSTLDVLTRYAKLTGFDQASGLPDLGTDTVQDMTEWAVHGLVAGGTEDVSLWATAEPGEAEEALATLGPVLASWHLPGVANDPDAWHQPPGEGAEWEPVEYHRTLLGGYSPAGLKTRTWGLDLQVHSLFRERYLVAIDCPVSREWVAPQGASPTGLSWEALKGEQAALAGLLR